MRNLANSRSLVKLLIFIALFLCAGSWLSGQPTCVAGGCLRGGVGFNYDTPITLGRCGSVYYCKQQLCRESYQYQDGGGQTRCAHCVVSLSTLEPVTPVSSLTCVLIWQSPSACQCTTQINPLGACP